jgi:hypothetical protein
MLIGAKFAGSNDRQKANSFKTLGYIKLKKNFAFAETQPAHVEMKLAGRETSVRINDISQTQKPLLFAENEG